MKKQAWMALAALTLSVTYMAVPAAAQSSRKVTAHIPFDFVAGGKLHEPGTYTVERLDPVRPDVLMIKDAQGRMVSKFSTQRVETRDLPESTQLVFRRYGDEHFLFEIQIAGDANGRRLPREEAEKELRRTGVEPELAVVTGKSASRH